MGGSYISLLNYLRDRKIRNRKWKIFLFSVFVIWYIDCLPDPLFSDSTSTVVLDRNGKLLSAHISLDEQWRFQECDSVPSKFKYALIEFEDRGFYSHFGVSISGLSRAFLQNISSGHRVSGGSTLTMQLVRLMRKNPPRTYSEKIYEIILATRIECTYSKEEILRLYASHAPFGNNVVGLEAASWRFFGRSSHELSWAESATLAVLPNAPGLIYPGRNHEQLLEKRNRLLDRLHAIGRLDGTSYEMALLEPLPDRPLPLPNQAPHLMDEMARSGKRGQTVRTTLDQDIQEVSNRLLEQHLTVLRENQIFNGAIVITEVKTGDIVAYVGNAVESGREHASYVNCIPAPRSSGSILKPLLYEKALESGQLTPEMLLMDIPSRFGNFSPKNFAGNFQGMIPADKALSASLNIPMVHLLNQYGLSHFHHDLQELGFTSIRQPAMHYGLSLILGGAEVRLQDLSSVYTCMAQQVRYGKVRAPSYFHSDSLTTSFPMDAGCIYACFDAMLDVRRPDEDNQWQLFESSRKIAWKTGTSFGFRDAWAVGVTPDYVVAVWIGNADGEGRPGLVGSKAAAPLLFDLFRQLPVRESWFRRPLTMRQVDLCSESGHRASDQCPNLRKGWLPIRSMDARSCPYHRIVHLDRRGEYRVNADCVAPSEMQHKPWFVLSPQVEKWYAQANPDYRPLPKMHPDCLGSGTFEQLAILYPKNGQGIYLPVDFNQQQRYMTLEGASSDPEMTLFWHLDDTFIGQTQHIHQMSILPTPGKHRLTVTDPNGQTRSVHFEVLGAAP